MTLVVNKRRVQGVTGSALFHLLLLVGLLVVSVPAYEGPEELAEILMLAAPPLQTGRQEAAPIPAAVATPTRRPAASSVPLPERPPMILRDDLVLPVPPRRETEMIGVDPSRVIDRTAQQGLERPPTRAGVDIGERALPPVAGIPGERMLPDAATAGLPLSPDRPFHIQWVGSSREVVSSVMPIIPERLEREVVLQYRFGVTPGGEVTNIRPLTRGEPALEEAVVTALQQWKFQPLPEASPQVLQEGVITFRFRIR